MSDVKQCYIAFDDETLELKRFFIQQVVRSKAFAPS